MSDSVPSPSGAAGIPAALAALRDETYRRFQIGLLPTVPPETVLGVRTPDLRRLARSLDGAAAAEFLAALPHGQYEENLLHALLLARIRDFDRCLAEVERFLPHVDNWAVCDQLRPAVFARRADRLPPAVDRWLASERPFTVRFGVGMLMCHFLDERFRPEQAARVAALRSGEYYVNMMLAWYFATALAKQYDAALPLVASDALDPWVRARTIQKALESFRVTPEHKAVLRALRAAPDRPARR